MTDMNLVLSFVTLDANNDQLNNIMEAVKFRRDKLARLNRFAIAVGSAVKFSHRGVDYNGTVKSIKVKKAVVECKHPNAVCAYDSKMRSVAPTINYTVPLNMLEAA